jgi:NAD(P)-dependent dehydrogenase (short-subunit alcohol dehydrogenase family)
MDGVVIVTGAGRGIGRAHALALARAGWSVVVNDLGVAADGTAPATGPADDVVAEIGQASDAVADHGDVSTEAGANALVATALDRFGRLDAVVNNAGILRDGFIPGLSEQAWDDVIQVHLKGHFAVLRHAAEYWKTQSKAGETVKGSVVNTASASGTIMPNAGQINYGAAKAGIAAFTQIAAQELGRYGVTANAVAPGALTRLTEDLGMPDEMTQRYDPRWVSPVIIWLASPLSADVTGQVIESSGLTLGVAEGWQRGPVTNDPPADPQDVDSVIRKLLADARPRTSMADVADG